MLTAAAVAVVVALSHRLSTSLSLIQVHFLSHHGHMCHHDMKHFNVAVEEALKDTLTPIQPLIPPILTPNAAHCNT